MKTVFATAAALLALSGTASLAEGDIEQGEKDFRKCKACHSIVSPEGEKVVRGGRTGPNLWGVVGRVAGTDPDFRRYSDEIQQLGETGFEWTEEEIAAYVPNASEYLEEKLDTDGVRTAMTPQRIDEPADVAAYLAQFGTTEAGDDENDD